jgi:hypothetical protein
VRLRLNGGGREYQKNRQQAVMRVVTAHNDTLGACAPEALDQIPTPGSPSKPADFLHRLR